MCKAVTSSHQQGATDDGQSWTNLGQQNTSQWTCRRSHEILTQIQYKSSLKETCRCVKQTFKTKSDLKKGKSERIANVNTHLFIHYHPVKNKTSKMVLLTSKNTFLPLSFLHYINVIVS